MTTVRFVSGRYCFNDGNVAISSEADGGQQTSTWLTSPNALSPNVDMSFTMASSLRAHLSCGLVFLRGLRAANKSAAVLTMFWS